MSIPVHSRPFGVGIVRDKNGKPRIDGDPKDMHPQVMMALRSDERRELGLWDGEFILDAQGLKRVKVSNGKVEILEPVVGAQLLSINGKFFKFEHRMDLKEQSIVEIRQRKGQ